MGTKAQYIVIQAAVLASIASTGKLFDTLAAAELDAEEQVLNGGGPRTILVSVGDVKSVSVVSELHEPPSDYATSFPSKMLDGENAAIELSTVQQINDRMPTTTQLDAAHADLQAKASGDAVPNVGELLSDAGAVVGTIGATPDVIASRVPVNPGV